MRFYLSISFCLKRFLLKRYIKRNIVRANGPKPELYRRYIDDCVGATSSTREELNQFITAVNLFHPALKYTWEISNTSLAFLDIKLSIKGNGLCTSVHYKPTDSHSYLLYSSSHPSLTRLTDMLHIYILVLWNICKISVTKYLQHICNR